MNSPILFPLLTTLFLSSIKSILNSNHHETLMIYKNCTSMSNNFPPQIFTSLFQELSFHSSRTNHYATSAGEQTLAISGRFQCLSDLTVVDCHHCVKKLAKISTTLCGQSIPARIHLSGCYSHFELDEPTFGWFSKLALQHKACGVGGGGGEVFVAAREEAFAAAEEDAAEKGYYYKTSREGMRVRAQCDGSLMEGCDCGECVSKAIEVAVDECDDSVSGEVYLDGCFLIYSYEKSRFSGKYYDNEMGGISSNEIIAIVVGGGVFLVGIVFFFHYKSWKKWNI